ncbi:uncharacterized protein YndB with AHSA1/START domain [Herbihabitans rhizosphaerae]|uniref:Uncharacterized protein YndB with AHSA1/START domain n=1 Tax=Herbihabitans rhizosphaerae TaxID=1872711 RepID=A0A4Q7KIU8_9PSEU|nr:SRPBCC family protein [Herbihabitans rhizosphaerae]RZS32838.1 uncharacterized protein YndB with AHSA1/START domain [Herbihabitans rhizosphaerae]
MIDVKHQINAVRRHLGTRKLEAGEARVLTISQSYDTTAEDLWDACTNAERIPRWFLPVTGDLKLGGRYQLEGNAGGTVERCDPPKSFAATWEYDGNVSWIEVRLSAESSERARFELEHVAHVADDWKQFGPGMVGIGWDMLLMGLYLHMSGAGSLSQEEAMAWHFSEEGLAFMAESSDRWRAADVEDGADPEQAKAAADRVYAAYTTQPEE